MAQAQMNESGYVEQPGFATLWDRRDTRKSPKGPDFSTAKDQPVVMEDGTEWEVAIWIAKKRNADRQRLRVQVQPAYSARSTGTDREAELLAELAALREEESEETPF